MKDTIKLNNGNEFPYIRLQVPSITAGHMHDKASVKIIDESIVWEASAGKVKLWGMCCKVNKNLWHMDFYVENKGPDMEVSISYPYIIYHFNQVQPVRIFDPMYGGILEVRKMPVHITYPGPASFCLTAASGKETSLASGIYNKQQRNIAIKHIPAGTDGQIRFFLERVMVRKDQKIAIPTQFISLGCNWAESMLPYKQWLSEQYVRQTKRVDWWVNDVFSETRKAHCLAPYHPPEAAEGIWIFDDEGRMRSFEDVRTEIDNAVMDGENKGYKPLFYQFAWWSNMAKIKGLFMFDSMVGDYTKAHDLTKRTIDYIHEKGMRTYLYTNVIGAGDESDVFKKSPELFVRDRSGLPVRNPLFPMYPMYMFCPGAPGMREYWSRNLEFILGSLNADGIFLDQACGGSPALYCYDLSHVHEHPDTYGLDFIELLGFITEHARALKEDCYVGGELYLDSRSMYFDESHGYGYVRPESNMTDNKENQITKPAAEYYIFTKYLCPDIFSQKGHSEDDIMNGAAGHYTSSIWKDHRAIFESQCRLCKVEPINATGYMFGPADGKVILAVRCNEETGKVRVVLPGDIKISTLLPAGIYIDEQDNIYCNASKKPSYYVLDLI